MEEHRKHPRLPLHWKVTIRQNEAGPILLSGETHEISLEGASILSEHNLLLKGEVLVELLYPPEMAGKPLKPLKIKSKMVYTIYSSDHYCFRTGVNFRQFLSDAKSILEKRLGQ